MSYAVSRRSVFQRISTAGGKTARLMRTMAKISADLDRALLDLQGEIECDVLGGVPMDSALSRTRPPPRPLLDARRATRLFDTLMSAQVDN